MMNKATGQILRQRIQVGMSDDENVEIVSGLSCDDKVLITDESYVIPQSKESGSNPFMPKFGRDKKNKS